MHQHRTVERQRRAAVPAPARAQRGRMQLSVALAALAVGVAVLVLRSAQPAMAADGRRTSLTAVIHRVADAPLHLAPAVSLQGMAQGDQLRLHARVTQPVRAILSAQEGGLPRVLFDGVLPADGELPVTVEAPYGIPPHLRLELCPLSQADTSCDTFDLQ